MSQTKALMLSGLFMSIVVVLYFWAWVNLPIFPDSESANLHDALQYPVPVGLLLLVSVVIWVWGIWRLTSVWRERVESAVALAVMSFALPLLVPFILLGVGCYIFHECV